MSGHTSKLEAAQASKTLIENNSKINSNQDLGRARAQIIKDALVERGVTADRIYTFDCADSMPIAPSDTEEGRMLHQRIYGIAMTAEDFFTGKGYGYRDSYAYYNRMCEQF